MAILTKTPVCFIDLVGIYTDYTLVLVVIDMNYEFVHVNFSQLQISVYTALKNPVNVFKSATQKTKYIHCL